MTTTAGSKPRRRWGRFALHYLEMIIAMFVGMFALGALLDLVGLGVSHHEHPELGYLVMAVNMSVGMAVWMRIRGHGWASTLEMCAAMFVPVVPLFPMVWLGVIDGGTLMTVAHVAMFPLMLAAMFRRLDEYAGCAH
jgi:flagellar biosynthetic protein FliP